MIRLGLLEGVDDFSTVHAYLIQCVSVTKSNATTINKAWKARSALAHPDKWNGSKKATQAQQKVNQAKSHLCGPERANYDAEFLKQVVSAKPQKNKLNKTKTSSSKTPEPTDDTTTPQTGVQSKKRKIDKSPTLPAESASVSKESSPEAFKDLTVVYKMFMSVSFCV